MPTTPAQQAHYRRNRRRYVAQAKEQRRANVAWLAGLKDKPCVDCGKLFPSVCMDWDHVRGEKVAPVSRLLTRNNRRAILAEIAKCDLVCANCHRIRTKLRS